MLKTIALDAFRLALQKKVKLRCRIPQDSIRTCTYEIDTDRQAYKQAEHTSLIDASPKQNGEILNLSVRLSVCPCLSVRVRVRINERWQTAFLNCVS